MYLFNLRKTQSIAIAAAIAASLAVSSQSFAASADVTYTAAGTFASPQVSGNDLFRLAGQSFSLKVVASEGTEPHSHGKGYATYTHLKATGTVHSGLTPDPVTLDSTETFMALALGNPDHDVVELVIPVTVIAQKITITAKITVPHGTFSKWTIAPWNAAAALSSANATVTYADSSNSTTLGIASGTVSAKAGSSSSSTAAAVLR